MALTLRLDKGSPLTHQELDDNFLHLSASISGSDFSLSGSFPADRLVVTADSASATAGGLATTNQLRTYDNNTSILIGGTQGSFGVTGLGMLIKEDEGSGDHVVLSDGSGSHLRLRAGGADVGDSYVMIQADQAGFAEEDIFTVAKFGGPNKGTELYHSGSLVFFTDLLNGDKSVYISGSLSGSKDVFFPALPNTTTPNIVGFDSASGQLTYYGTGSFGGGITLADLSVVLGSASESGSLSYNNSTGEFTFNPANLSGLGGGSTDYVSNVTLNGTTLEFTGVGSAFGSGVDLATLSGSNTDITSLNNFTSSAQSNLNALNTATSSFVTNSETSSFLYSGSYNSSTNEILLYSVDTNYSLDLSGLAGGGGSGLALTASDEGVVKSENVRSIDFVGNAVVASNSGNAVTVTINTGSDANTNIYSTDGTLANARSIGAGGNNLTFEFADAHFIIDSDGAQQVQINNLPTEDTPQVVGYVGGVLKAMNTSSIAGTSTDISALNLFTGSIQTEVDSLTAATSSYLTASDTGSFYISSSVANNTITFNQGGGTTESVTVDTGSDTNLGTADQDLTGARTVTANGSSLTFQFDSAPFIINSDNAQRVTIANLPTEDQPQVVGIDSSGNLKAMNTSSIAGGGTPTDITALNNFTGSIQTEVDSLTAATSSYLTASDTGSFYVSSSVSSNTITFNQGDGTTESVTVSTGSVDYTIQRAVEYVPNNTTNGATDLQLIVGSVRISSGASTVTTTNISQLGGRTAAVDAFITATLQTNGTAEAVATTGIDVNGAISFKTSANVTETSDIMYHVFLP